MASGTIQRPPTIVPYKSGETLNLSDVVCAGQTTSARIMRIYFTLPKPAASGVSVKMYCNFTAKIGVNQSYSLTIGSSSSPVNLAYSGVPGYYYYSYTASANSWKTNSAVALYGTATLKFG